MTANEVRLTHPERVLWPDGGFAKAVRVAHLVRGLVDELGLACSVKTSGADGIHVLVPIARRHDYDTTRAFAVAVAELLEARHPELVTTEWRKEKRGDSVLLDAMQNGPGKT